MHISKITMLLCTITSISLPFVSGANELTQEQRITLLEKSLKINQQELDQAKLEIKILKTSPDTIRNSIAPPIINTQQAAPSITANAPKETSLTGNSAMTVTIPITLRVRYS